VCEYRHFAKPRGRWAQAGDSASGQVSMKQKKFNIYKYE